MFSSVSGNKGSLQGRCWYCVTLFLIFLWRCLRKCWSRTSNLVCLLLSQTPSTLSPGGGLWWQPSPTWCCARPACCSTGQCHSYTPASITMINIGRTQSSFWAQLSPSSCTPSTGSSCSPWMSVWMRIWRRTKTIRTKFRISISPSPA